MNPKLKKFIREVAILLVMVMSVSVAVNLYKTWNVERGPAPQLLFANIAGKPVMAQPAGEPMLVHFWATWCPICALEQDSIQSIAQDYAVVTVAMQSGNAEELRQFMHKEGLNFTVVADEFGEIAKQWSVRGVPASFIIAPDGNIRFVEVGYTSEIGLRARLWWAGS
ncbi:MAG: protein disulfide oxidoreductase [Gammaproteobacteria bacterium]|nr:protein disulfide oxidoreductase [Gammaproteobacteria bacterium]